MSDFWDHFTDNYFGDGLFPEYVASTLAGEIFRTVFFDMDNICTLTEAGNNAKLIDMDNKAVLIG